VEAGESRTGGVEATFREAYGKAVATLVRVFGDITRAEDAVQDAFVVATEMWPESGIPPNPAGWIVTTARNRAIDLFRREKRGREIIEELAFPGPAVEEVMEFDDVLIADDQLRLIFTCCHPSLSVEHQVALTLRLLGGLSVSEVARSFLVTEAAMTKRLTRAKYKIKAANIPYRIPEDAALPNRLRAVLVVLYLIYNTGADGVDRASLRADAIRLARALSGLMPDEPEAAGLLALMLLGEARAAARLRDDDVVLLRDQDRSQWDRALIEEGQTIVQACIRRDHPGPYQLQAAIQAVHCDATSIRETDWPQIVELYDHLYSLQPTAVVALNRAIAVGEARGAEEALEALDAVAADLANYYLMHAARGATLRQLGRRQDATEAYQRAAGLATNERDVRFLNRQVEDLASAD